MTTNQIITKARRIAKKYNELIYVYVLADEVEFLGPNDGPEPKNMADFVVHPEGDVEF